MPPKLPPRNMVLPNRKETGTAPSRVPKKFKIETKTAAEQAGELIVLYGKSGIGKSTLAAMAPNPILIPLEGGGLRIKNNLTGESVPSVADIETVEDLREALQQVDLFPAGSTVIIDNFTVLEHLIEPYLFRTYKAKDGSTVTTMRKYGWDGPGYLLEAYRLILSDLDRLARRGCNVVVLAQLGQVTVANAEGLDYLEDGPKLQHNKQYSVRTEVCEWADHVLRIGYLNLQVQSPLSDVKAAGKVANSEGTRAVYAGGAPHYIAKTRPVQGGEPLPDVISFEGPADNTLWQFMFPTN